MPRLVSDRFFSENLRRLAEDRANSDILDSRIRFWCDRLQVDPAVRYEALANGRSIAFVTRRRGSLVTLHRIKPGELA